MKIKFNNKDYSIRQNEDGLYSLNDIERASKLSGNCGDTLQNWKESVSVVRSVAQNKITLIATRGRNGGTWGCSRAAIHYASHCSKDVRRAITSSVAALISGDSMKGVAIARNVISYERSPVPANLINDHDTACKRLNELLNYDWNAYSNFYKMACKAATGYSPAALTGRNGTVKDYITASGDCDCMEALTATIEFVCRGLKVGLDYHTNAFMLNVKTTKSDQFPA
ncbi:KilA-N domain-containing protein [Aeromonas veronii]|uniref:KilA-N domain-containing protein n=1 Tax=Aeromonas veronii TaxID=654 RepID=UPI0029A3596A|nr:KilA-N domain-containing protein [Aeromonas veronii]